VSQYHKLLTNEENKCILLLINEMLSFEPGGQVHLLPVLFCEFKNKKGLKTNYLRF